jgi:diguanylate cyclase (GGDEF)-like protein
MLLVLSEITREDALASAERLRKTICTLDIESGGAVLPLITVSIGVSLFPYHGTTADTLITAADHALYEAKTGGRNRVCVAKEKEPSHEEVEVQRVVE